MNAAEAAFEAEAAAIDQVLEAEREWITAHRKLDLAALDRLMADDYIHVHPDGRADDKTRALATYQLGAPDWEHGESDEYFVRIYGEVAVVMGRWSTGGYRAGESFDYTARFIKVYVKRAGRWQIVADQSTHIL